MTLIELVNELKKYEKDKIVNNGFKNPHSYRGYYHCIAFEPCGETTVGKMLELAEGAIGKTYTGWKGGDFTMYEDTNVFIAYEGCTSDDEDEFDMFQLKSILEVERECPRCGAKYL